MLNEIQDERMNKNLDEQIDQQIEKFLVELADYYGVEQLTEEHIRDFIAFFKREINRRGIDLLEELKKKRKGI